jgi:Dolichyl-phosphate-mannose-protein mannosyltransferase
MIPQPEEVYRQNTPIPSSSLKCPAYAPLEKALYGIPSPGKKILLAALAVVSFCLIINSSWNATPDSALYLSLGKSLAQGRGYVFNGEHHTLVPPGFPMMLAVLARSGGAGFLRYRALIALMGLLTAAAAYLLLLRMCGPGVAFVIGGVFALNHTLLHYSKFILADVPFALFTAVALNAALSASRGRNLALRVLAAGLLVSVLPLIRINGLGVAPAVAIYMVCTWKDQPWIRRFLYIGLFLIVAYVPFLMWQAWKAPFAASSSEGSYLAAVCDKNLWVQFLDIATSFRDYFPETCYALTGLEIKTGFLEIIPPLFVIWGMILSFVRGDRLLVPLTVIQLCGLLLSSAGDRYLLFLLPALYLFLAVGILDAAERILVPRANFPAPAKLLTACFGLIALFNVGHNMTSIFHARTALEANAAESDRSLPYFVAARWLKAHAPNAVVLTTHARIIHYLSACHTVALVRSGVPDREVWVNDEKQARALIQSQHPDYIFTDGKNAHLYSQVFKAVSHLGLSVQEIPGAGSPPRYRLFKINCRHGG